VVLGDASAASRGTPRGGGGEVRQETSIARSIRAGCLATGRAPGEIARLIHAECEPAFGTTLVRAHRLALGIALADVVAQVRARYVAGGRTPPRFSETLLSAYESGQKRPGPEYLHYLCCVYQAEPEDLGYDGGCLCGNRHRCPVPALVPGPDGPEEPAGGAGRPGRRGPAAASPQPASASWAATASELLPASVPPAPGGETLAAPASGAYPPAGPVAAVIHPASAADQVTHLAADPEPETTPLFLMARAPRARAVGNRTGGPAAAGQPAAGSPAGLAETDDDAVRRALLRLTADPAAPVESRFFGAAERIRRRLDDALLEATVSVTMLEHWEEAVAEYGRLYMTVPPLRLLCDVLLDLGDVRRMCEHRQPLEFGERLCALAARLAGLAGMIMINVADQRLARSFFSTARSAADETGDRPLRAWVAVREALVPLYYGDPRQAAAAARAGADLAGRKACPAGVMAPIVEARAVAWLARTGGGGGRGSFGRRVNLALQRAHDAFEALPAEQQAGTAFGYTERQLLFHEGDALVTLGDYRGADDAFRQAMRQYAPDEFLDRSLVTLGQARCRFAAGEPEEAIRLSQETLRRLPSQYRPGLVLRAARSLGDAVAAKHGDLPAMRDYREALLTG
jgi:tetratricopeptide (TPR) repeat protein